MLGLPLGGRSPISPPQGIKKAAGAERTAAFRLLTSRSEGSISRCTANAGRVESIVAHRLTSFPSDSARIIAGYSSSVKPGRAHGFKPLLSLVLPF